MAVDLIPASLKNINDPLNWERSCASGDFNSYATQFAKSLVSAGLGDSVIRLGAEANGVWENDYIGPTKVEQHLWAKCFDQEVTGMRRATGEHLLIDWNPNACKGDYPYPNYYPGNAYVDIMGFDLFDVACEIPTTPVTFAQLAGEVDGLNRFEAFAARERKPMSFPEWALSIIPSGDDPAYINGIGSTVMKGDFAFQTYFDGGGPNIKALPLTTQTPMSLAAYRKWFGNAS